MHRKGLRDKFFAIVIHVCAMTFIITTERNRSIGYINLFPWLTDFRWIYFIIVIVTEGLILLIHGLEFIQFCHRSDTENSDTSDNRRWEKRFNWVILVLLVGGYLAQTVLLGFSLSYVEQVRHKVDEDLYEWVTEFYGLPDLVSVTETINDLQRHEECCGVFDYHDYNNSAYAKLTTYDGRVVPLTCFRIPEEGIKATGQEIDESKIYDKGCFEALIDVYNGYFHIVWNYTVISALNATDLVWVVYNMIHEKQIKKKHVLRVWRALVFIGHAVIAVLYLVLYVKFDPPYSALFEGMSENYKKVWLIVFCIECLVLVLELYRCGCCLTRCCDLFESCPEYLNGILIVALFVGQCVGLGFALTNMDRMRDLIAKEMPEKVTQFYGMPGQAAITSAINDLQEKGHCCGAYSYTDYISSAFAKLPNGFQEVPATCYMKAEDWQTAGDDIDSSKIHTKGCMEVLVKLFETLFRSFALCSITMVLYLVDLARRYAKWKWRTPTSPGPAASDFQPVPTEQAEQIEMHCYDSNH